VGWIIVWIIQEGKDMVIVGDVLNAIKFLPKYSFDMVITSPPYYRRRKFRVVTEFPDGWVGELGWEPSPEMYVDHLAYIFKKISDKMCECCPILVNIDDTKVLFNDKDERIVFNRVGGRHIDISGLLIQKMEDYGLKFNHKFILIKKYFDIKKNKLIKLDNRPIVSHSFEYALLFTKSYDCFSDIVYESDVITMKREYVTQSLYHPAKTPFEFIEYFINLLTKESDTILDPFGGTGTVGVIARENNRHFILIEAIPQYINFDVIFGNHKARQINI